MPAQMAQSNGNGLGLVQAFQFSHLLPGREARADNPGHVSQVKPWAVLAPFVNDHLTTGAYSLRRATDSHAVDGAPVISSSLIVRVSFRF